TLTISQQATANAGSDATICEGSTYTMIAPPPMPHPSPGAATEQELCGCHDRR
ncbi:MAG: hypothetical protein IPF68_16920, partial [Bacteroidales bacterium]|nr:hypothetical protein [Bacteroidales bacterium]